MSDSNSPQPSRHNTLSYLLTCGMVIGLSVVTYKYGWLTEITGAITDLAANLRNVM